MIKTEYDNYGNKLAEIDSYGLNSSVSGSLSRGFPRSFSIVVGRGDLESISGSILYYWRSLNLKDFLKKLEKKEKQ